MASTSHIHNQAFHAEADLGWIYSFGKSRGGVKQSIVVLSHKSCLAGGKERDCYMTYEKQRKLGGLIVEHSLRGNPEKVHLRPGHICTNLYDTAIIVPSSSIQ